MAVVIDEMQVETVEPRPPQQRRGGDGDGGGGGGAEKSPAPEEVERIWRRQHERQERVRAY
ncbi:MAG TPA: hypothetical protein VM936_07250 [Pyrinomonadaceae bacterium]|jgi:hypothetical protein|nr:hypothetical protein [Pyrinomonadaceae bacterium]